MIYIALIATCLIASSTQQQTSGDTSMPGYLPDYQGDRYTNQQRIDETRALNKAFFDNLGYTPSPPPETPAQQRANSTASPSFNNNGGFGSNVAAGRTQSNDYSTQVFRDGTAQSGYQQPGQYDYSHQQQQQFGYQQQQPQYSNQQYGAQQQYGYQQQQPQYSAQQYGSTQQPQFGSQQYGYQQQQQQQQPQYGNQQQYSTQQPSQYGSQQQQYQQYQPQQYSNPQYGRKRRAIFNRAFRPAYGKA